MENYECTLGKCNGDRNKSRCNISNGNNSRNNWRRDQYYRCCCKITTGDLIDGSRAFDIMIRDICRIIKGEDSLGWHIVMVVEGVVGLVLIRVTYKILS